MELSVSSRRGQSLIELIVAIGIGVLFITAAIGIISLSFRLDFQNKFSQTAGGLAQETLEQVITFANADWHNIDTLENTTPYHPVFSGGFFTAAESGSSTVSLEGAGDYEVSFMTDRVYRDTDPGNVDGFVAAGSGTYDPSTIKITVSAEQTGQVDRSQRASLVHYLTRSRDRVWWQQDWSAGSSTPWGTASFSNATNTAWGDQALVPPETAGQLTIFDKTKNLQASVGNGIDPQHHYAWNDVTGWIDFIYYHNITVGSAITGYAQSSAIGDIALNCNSTPNGNICLTPPGNPAVSDFAVMQDANGIVYGFGWNDQVGWISFNCSNGDATNPNGNCATNNSCPVGQSPCSVAGGNDYNVSIDGSGYFHGMAWNDAIGWISFNSADCDLNSNGYVDVACAGDDTTTQAFAYDVKSGANVNGVGELESITYDTARNGGAGFNTIMWQGAALPSGARVLFQTASSDCSNGANNAPTCTSGTWAFVGPAGTANDYYEPTGPNVPMRINRTYHNNDRYMRYRLLMLSDTALVNGPTVYDVIINWSH